MHTQTSFRTWRRIGLLTFVLALGAWTGLALAADAGTDDPPARVARVSYVAGDVGLLPHGDDAWRDVDANRPLTTGDRLTTGTGARLELEFGNAVLRLGGDTAFGFLDLGDWQTRASLTSGKLELGVQNLPDGEDYEIDTPQVAVVVDRAATVRVELGEDGDATTVSVREGSAVVYGEDGARQVAAAGERYRFADASLDDVVAMAPLDDDAFYRWCRSRDQMYVDARDSGRYVSDGTVGYRDLDRYGQWQAEADYGQVWFPDDVGPDWVPYREGHWSWVAPWGWTWISDAPWGFAPFHYGRWMTFGGRWGWIPGTAGVPAVYAPALVAFVGGGNWRVSIGFGGAPVGWYPLAPGMVYNPWYAASRRYYWRVNRYARHRHHRHWRRHVDEAYNAWRKPERLRHVHYLGKPPHGVTVVSRKVLAGGHDVHKARLLHVDTRSMRRAPVRFHGVHVRPDARRRAGLHAPAVYRLPVKDFARSVVARPRRILAASDKGRPTHTPWASPVRLLGHGRPRVVIHKHRPGPHASRPERSSVPRVRGGNRSVHAVAPEVARRHVTRPIGHAASRNDSRHEPHAMPPRRLPVVPRLKAGTAPHARPVPVRRTPMRPARTPSTPVRHAQVQRDRHSASLPSPPRRLTPVTPRPSPHRSVPHVQRHVPGFASRPRPQPRPVMRRAPPVRAASRPRRPSAIRPVQPVRRPVARPRPSAHATKSRPARRHSPGRHGVHQKPVRFKTH